MTGVVRMVSETKRFGFIKADKGDYFFHSTSFNGHFEDLVDDFQNNKKIEVEFDGFETPKGLRAENVSRKDWPNQAAREYHG